MKETFVIQYSGKEKTREELEAEAVRFWVEAGGKKTGVKKIALYIQPDSEKVYFVINDDFKGDFNL